ncbi:MAG: DUF3943 domain-containing protein [Sphingobacteriales bacterium]|nr:MAG: DUF3943 domain-containing protein [Sphingobacteriales bacterium]
MCFGQPLFAQTSLDGQQLIADSLDKTPSEDLLKNRKPRTKHFGRAVAWLGIAEVTPWIFDRYVANMDYARISFKTVGHNLKLSSWSWDKDPFQTNQFGHPYHGSLFFSSFRANGYSFWESVPAVFVGSYIWETFAENEPPSPNDFVNTSFGGIVLGEMTYRLSNKIVNERSRGFKRQASEIAGFLLNPMNGLTRITTGKWGRVSRRKDADTSRVSAEFDIGLRKFSTNSSSEKFAWFGKVKLLYGNPYENYRTPFSNMYINAELGQDDSSKVNVINVYGSLAGWEIKSNEKLKHLAVLSANYDYINNEAFFYSGQSVRINTYSEYKLSNELKLNTGFSAGAVILAAVPDQYLYNTRNYNYTSGANIGAGGGISIAEKLYCGFDYRGSWLKTINGNSSHYFLHSLTGDFRYLIGNGLSVTAQPGYLNLYANYRDFKDVNRKYPYLRISARYNVAL